MSEDPNEALFTASSNTDFIHAAYRVILGREADEAGRIGGWLRQVS